MKIIAAARLIPLLGALLLAGCTSLRTDKAHYAGMDRLMESGSYSLAIARLEAAKERAYAKKDRVVYYLDLGMLHHWSGDYERSNELLEEAERAIEENFTRSLTRSASSMIMNDNILAYAGEDYEDIYLNIFKALNYLALAQPDEAFVEVRRINEKLTALGDKYEKVAKKLNEAEEARETFLAGKNRFVESALARYLSLLLYRREQRWDDVRIDRKMIDDAWKKQPRLYPFSQPDLKRTTQKLAPETARLNIMAFTGIAPDKTASTFYIHTEENLVVLAGSTENYLGKQELAGLQTIPWIGLDAGFHFKLQLPSMKKQPSKVGRIEVVVNQRPAEPLEQLESLERAATETFAIQKPLIFLKTITRSVLKGLAAEQAKQQMTKGMGDGGAFFARIAADLVIDSTENADLRISRFFPAAAHIRELHLPPGTYTVTINYYNTSGLLIKSDVHPDINLQPGHLTLVESAHLN